MSRSRAEDNDEDDDDSEDQDYQQENDDASNVIQYTSDAIKMFFFGTLSYAHKHMEGLFIIKAANVVSRELATEGAASVSLVCQLDALEQILDEIGKTGDKNR